MRRVREFDCTDCGRPTTRMLSSYQPRICHSCANSRVIANALQIARHEGPAWEKWRAGMVRAGISPKGM